ncbi:MAG: AEC family transporter [Clostridia bacterium]|nr:AEC family transporter [Clostridia bacterium]
MEIFYSTLGQTMYLFLLILIGFVLAKTKILPQEAAKVLAKLENWIFIPALMLKTFMDDFTVDRLGRSGSIFLFSAGALVVITPLAILISRVLAKDTFTRNIFTYGLAFSNFGYMGISVVAAVFPQYASDYLVFTMPLYILIYMWGVPALLMKDGEKTTFRQNLKSLLNPMFIGMFIGMAIGLLRSVLPVGGVPQAIQPSLYALDSVIGALKSCMSPVAMLLTGITVANIDFKKTFTNLQIYSVTAVRLLVLPLVFLSIFKLLPILPESFFVCLMASLAMPLGLNTVVVPSAYGKDVSVAAGMALVSHLLSCVTIPLVFLFM